MSLLKASFLSEMKPLKEIMENLESYGEMKHLDTKKKQVEPDEIWEHAIKKMDAPLASKLSRAKFTLAGDELTVILNGTDSLFVDSIEKNMEAIKQIFSEELGTNITLKIKTVKEHMITKKDLKEKILEEPIIKEALELFDGRIADVTPKTEDRE
jgi:DNA polymerase-3 subunit gamma/tau